MSIYLPNFPLSLEVKEVFSEYRSTSLSWSFCNKELALYSRVSKNLVNMMPLLTFDA